MTASCAIALTLADSQDISSALSLLCQHQLSHLPVVDPSGQLVGIVTPATICQALQPPLGGMTSEVAAGEWGAGLSGRVRADSLEGKQIASCSHPPSSREQGSKTDALNHSNLQLPAEIARKQAQAKLLATTSHLTALIWPRTSHCKEVCKITWGSDYPGK